MSAHVRSKYCACIVAQAAAKVDGRMVHTILSKAEVAAFRAGPVDGLNIASINHIVDSSGLLSVSLCGSAASVAARLAKKPEDQKLRPQNPWHHPEYATTISGFDGGIPAGKVSSTSCLLISCSKATAIQSVDETHWLEWMSSPLDFAAAIECVAKNLTVPCSLRSIELGAHPVMEGAAKSICLLSPAVEVIHASTMKRGVAGAAHIKVCSAPLHQ